MAHPPWRPPSRRCCHSRVCGLCLCTCPWPFVAGLLALTYSVAAFWFWATLGPGMCSSTALVVGVVGSGLSALAVMAALAAYCGLAPAAVRSVPAAPSIAVVVAAGGHVVAEAGVRACCTQREVALFPASACAAASRGGLDLLGALRPGLIALAVAIANDPRLGSRDFAEVGCALVAGAAVAIAAAPPDGWGGGALLEYIVGSLLLFAAARSLSHVIGCGSNEHKVGFRLAPDRPQPNPTPPERVPRRAE